MSSLPDWHWHWAQLVSRSHYYVIMLGDVGTLMGLIGKQNLLQLRHYMCYVITKISPRRAPRPRTPPAASHPTPPAHPSPPPIPPAHPAPAPRPPRPPRPPTHATHAAHPRCPCTPPT